ncbi:hypothetical protein OH799_14160 [Nocardia sp. NBC_00881]|uniref:hypothetical protein n=1 Tax=Nocardia sp. NBC_00881 TaxID=2975995 RepID=UPI0038634E4A|nr:hypothetical protein OH799_14160 [Nocardia sp. NBC_00881]
MHGHLECAELDQIAGLPAEFVEDGNGPQATRFDYLVLRVEYASLTGEPGFPALKTQVQEVAAELLSPSLQNIPAAVADKAMLLPGVGAGVR